MKLYALWTTLVLSLAFAHAGLNRDTVTRLLVLAYLALNLAIRPKDNPKNKTQNKSQRRFILACTLNSLAVEFFYMFSRPVFDCLLFQPGDSPTMLLQKTLIDWLFTFPAYLVIYKVFWLLLQRYRYSLTEYALLFSAGQALGDGNAFFCANPAMLLFLPYVMLNYQAANVVPYLSLQPTLTAQKTNRWAPLIAIPLTYLVMGACIHLASPF